VADRLQDRVRSGEAGIADLLTRCTFPAPATPAVAAVSGGADSLALLVLAVAADLDVVAVHVDHGLRPDADRESRRVDEVAAALGVASRSLTVDVGVGSNLEARARRARHDALAAEAAGRTVLFGHTADDQAETVLGNLVRGAGLGGVAGIRRGPRHPILALRRTETETLCRRLDLDMFADPSNADPSFRRNRLRREVLPLLDDVAGRDVVPLLARHAEVAGEAVDHLAAEAARLVPDPASCVALRGAPPVLAAMALHAWLRSCSPEAHPPDAAALERVLAVARGERRAAEIGGGFRVERSAGRLAVVAPTGSPPGTAQLE